MVRLHELYDLVAKRTPSSPAFVCHRPLLAREQLTYSELAERSCALASGLRRALDENASAIVSSSAENAGAKVVVALQISRLHKDFLPAFLAASRCGATVVFLSTDLRSERSLEEARARLAISELRPSLLLVESVAEAAAKALVASVCDDSVLATATRVVAVETLGCAGAWDACAGNACDEASPPLCFLFTGGTTRGRCVAVTHDMVAHESRRYPECLDLPANVRVLAHTSVYWGASAIGQLSIALAYGGCAVLSEATEPDDLRKVIAQEAVDVLGIVPDQLRTLSDDPAVDLPNVRAVFTWGEQLPAALAERWRGHPSGAKVRELLISTEYWLALFAAPLEAPGAAAAASRYLRPVRDARVLVVGADGVPVGVNEVGEFLLAGPMVSSGYVAISSSRSSTTASQHTGADAPADATTSPFRTVDGTRYFCTGDLVRVVARTGSRGDHSDDMLLEYRGRADMTTKEKGKWVDLRDVEERLRSTSGVKDIVVLPDPRGGSMPHACLALEHGAAWADILRAARGALPRNTEVHVFDHLPRHPVTRKVDLAQLKRMAYPSEAIGEGAAWPLVPGALCAHRRDTGRLNEKVRRHINATLVAVLVGAAWDARTFARLAAAALAYLRGKAREASARAVRVPSGAGVAMLPFMHLAYLHAADAAPTLVGALERQFPLKIWGVMAALIAVRGLATRSMYRRAAGMITVTWAAVGAALALSRGRFLSYPVVYWAGIGHRLEFDCMKWLRLRTWKQHFYWQAHELIVDVPQALFSTGARCVHAAIAPGRKALAAAATRFGAASTVTHGTGELDRPAVESENAHRWSTDSLASSSHKCRWSNRPVLLECPPPASLAPRPWEQGDSRTIGGFFNGQGEAVGWQSWPVETAAALSEARSVAESILEEPTSMASSFQIVPDAAACNVGSLTIECDSAQSSSTREGAPDSKLPDGSPKLEGSEWNRDDMSKWRKSYDNWWWYQKVSDTLEVTPEAVRELKKHAVQPAASDGVSTSKLADPRMRRICHSVVEVSGNSGFSDPSAPLLGLDSLSVALITTRLRAEFRLTSLSVGAVRRAATVAELLEMVDLAQQEQPASAHHDTISVRGSEGQPSQGSAQGREYALFFSPGQVFPMGAWVVRIDEEVHVDCLEEAARRLVDRHAALRTQARDPLRLLSFCLDTGILFTMVARRLEQGPWLARALRRLLSWGLRTSWSRVSPLSREQVYGRYAAKAPFTVLKVSGQEAFEQAAKDRRNVLGEAYEPLDLALVQLEAQLVGHWVYGRQGGEGDFAILDQPSGLTFVDRNKRYAGVLVGPGDARWRAPPPGFPALLFATLSPPSAGVVWLRLSRAREAVVLWKRDTRPETSWKRLQAYRMPSASAPTTTFNFLVASAMHSISDGQSYESIVGDLLTLYAAQAPRAEGAVPAELPLVGDAFAVLERRLYNALDGASPLSYPQQCSLRGSIWKHRGRGYGHSIRIPGDSGDALRLASLVYGAPPDALLLALAAASIARASSTELVPLSLYVPNRDGAGESGLVGLFSDWRDIEVKLASETATILGAILQVSHTLRHRRWALFNALHKPEVSMINFQPCDTAPRASRAGFVQVGEELWRSGEWLRRGQTRGDELSACPQPLSITIEQQNAETWWVHVNPDYDSYPPHWVRRFVRSFEDAFRAALVQPGQRVHSAFPADFY